MGIIEGIVVAFIVACAAVYAAWTLMPQSLRVRTGVAAGRWATEAGPMPGFVRQLLLRFADSQARRAPGCAGCSNAKAPTKDDPARRQNARRA